MKTLSLHARPVSPSIGLAPVQFMAAALSALLWAALCALAALGPGSAHAQSLATPTEATSTLQAEVSALLKQQTLPQGSSQDAAAQPQAWRVEVVLGELDPRLKLAPCEKVHAYMPSGMRMWGRTRVGLRCEQGRVHWNVYWPVTVKVWGQGLVAAEPLRAGNLVSATDLRVAEVDLAERGSPAVPQLSDIVGRTLSRGIQAGQSVREDDLRVRRWFAAGDPVRLTLHGQGFQIAAGGIALTPGDEGQCARIRTDSGRIVCGNPVGERLAELSL